MSEHTLKHVLTKLNSYTATLNLHLFENYSSPPDFPPLTTRKGVNKHNRPVYSRLDYILTNTTCSVSTEFVKELSDYIFFNINLELHKSGMRRVLSIDRNRINRELNLLINEDINSTLTYIKENMLSFKKARLPKISNRKHVTFHLPLNHQRLLSEWVDDFKNFVNNIITLRFSIFQGLAFQKLRCITKYDQFQKRDGTIKVIKDQDSNIITHSESVDKALIGHLRKNDNRFPDRNYINWNKLPKLKKPTFKELANLLRKVSIHKALTYFPVPDEHIKYLLANNRLDFFRDLWDQEILNHFPEIFESKLIPLNKVHPEVPSVSQMRPIVATNVLFKILELRFSEELHLKFWKLGGYALSQIGFLKNMNTQAQIYNLLSQITKDWKRFRRKKLHLHQPSLNPLLPQYNPEHNYIIFIDFKEAYNSINMGLLYEMMKIDKILDEDKLTYLFTLYSKLKIRLNKESFSPKNGVPQGGINSPILFNFAMYYFLSEAARTINYKIQFSCHLPQGITVMTPEKNFLWADDLASLIKAHPHRAKEFIKIYFETLIEASHKWGLPINFDKSAIMEFFTLRTSYDYLSDVTTIWIKDKGTEIHLNISPNGIPTTIKVPVVTEYKYLGVRISRDLQPTGHLKALKKKINFIVNAFKAVGGAGQNLKFCVNTWHIFIRPLLDYSQTYFSFLEESHREKLFRLYRESARKMMFLKGYTPNYLVDSLNNTTIKISTTNTKGYPNVKWQEGKEIV